MDFTPSKLAALQDAAKSVTSTGHAVEILQGILLGATYMLARAAGELRAKWTVEAVIALTARTVIGVVVALVVSLSGYSERWFPELPLLLVCVACTVLGDPLSKLLETFTLKRIRKYLGETDENL